MNVNSPQSRGFALPGLRGQKNSEQTASGDWNRLPFLEFLPNGFRNHLVAMLGEFAGTFLFLFFAFSGTQVANTRSTSLPEGADPARLLYISLCFGFSLAVNAWVFFRISGGLFNPAVTLGMSLVGALSWVRGGFLILSQILGGIAAAGVVLVLFPGPLNIRTSLGGGTTVIQGLFIEMFLTAQLVFTIFMLAAEKHKGTFIAPVGIGLSLFIAELTGVYYTGGSVNPARSFGPCVVLHSFYDHHWIYWIGPILGTLLASAFYKLIKILEYETANPGQDMNDTERQRLSSEQNLNTPMVDFVRLESPLEQNMSQGSISGYTNTNLSVLNEHHLPNRYSSNVVEQPNRQSAMKNSTRTSNLSPVGGPLGHIYIEGAKSHEHRPKAELVKHVPRIAGHS